MGHQKNAIEWIVQPISDLAGLNQQWEKICINQCGKRNCEIDCTNACDLFID